MKHIKMVLYGEPGVGKSVFCTKAPKPFFITTDGNYEYLDEFGAKEEDHVQVNSWAEAKKAFTRDFTNYDTIVVDLTEDLFKWCEFEYCKVNGYEHVSDVGFGKGYDITRNDFIINLSKLLNKENKNIILLMHGLTYTVKDRRGVEHTKYGPTNRIPDKVLDQIEGKVRYFLRCYIKSEDIDGKLVKKRYLSLIPKENEYGILRGVDEEKIPADIPLDFTAFASCINLEVSNNNVEKKVKKEVKKEVKEEVEVVDIKLPETKKEVKEKVEEVKVELPKEDLEENESKPEPVEVAKPLSKEEKLAAIKAKLMKMKK